MAARKQTEHNVSSLISEEIDNDLNLFREAVKDARPFTAPLVHSYKLKPKPIPRQFIRDEQQALVDSLSDHFIPAHEMETGEELLYLRDGHSPVILSKLRRGHWVVHRYPMQVKPFSCSIKIWQLKYPCVKRRWMRMN